MRLHRLSVQNFGGIGQAEVAFGPGLNVLHGPNDLGKSTLAQAIRLVLLLPHTSTHGEAYVPWTGGQDPVVELTFETEAQRIWRVRKVFGKGGSSLLQESRDGRDFDDVARARAVDGRLREILGWGIPEPGGAGAGKGLPSSFLATVLLSTQGDVSDLLAESLTDDGVATGKDRIAAALQAVAQDPLFVRILNDVQERRDEAFTDKGARKTAKGSVFKVAADRLREAREARDALEKQVLQSADVESDLKELIVQRSVAQDALAEARTGLDALRVLAEQAAARATADAAVAAAQAEVARIRGLDGQVTGAEQRATALEAKKVEAEQAVSRAEATLAAAEEARTAAEAVAGGADPTLADTVQRQQQELRLAAAETREKDARQQLAAIVAAEAVAKQAETAALQAAAARDKATAADAEAARAEAAVQGARAEVERGERLERGLEARAARERVDAARASRAQEEALTGSHAAAVAEHGALQARRAALVVPTSVAPMGRLQTERAAARGALAVGLVVTVTPAGLLDLVVAVDGTPAVARSGSAPVELEANAELELGIGPLATVRVRGGRREAQEKAAALEARWEREVAPHLAAAGVADLEGLEQRIADAKDLDHQLQVQAGTVANLAERVAALAGAAERLRAAEDQLVALGPVEDVAPIAPDALKKQRTAASKGLDVATTAAGNARNGATLARERATQLGVEAAAARSRQEQGPPPSARATAEASLAGASTDQQEARAALAALSQAQASRQQLVDQRVRGAVAAVDAAKLAHTKAGATLATITGDLQFAVRERARLTELRAAEDLDRAEQAVVGARDRYASLPVPARAATAAEVQEAERGLARSTARLAQVEGAIQLTRGRLMQVGGAVAKERLAIAREAYDIAEQQEKELEATYDAWRLLLDQLKDADAAQASNLGQALAPGLSEGFAALTGQRYDRVQLAASLSTDGVVAAGAVRDPGRLSVGTREQLSTLYRLCLAEHLRTALVLDDQLVQSDQTRMDWFRATLHEKARQFQIVVFTCRVADYLGTEDLARADERVRAVDLDRCIRRR